MTRFTACFKTSAAQNRPATIPFLMLGDPSPEESIKIITAVITSGVDAIELGLPFSDPIADGQVVSQAAARACQFQLCTDDYFAMIGKVRQQFPAFPIGILVYANLVFRYGIDAFYRQANACGIDCVLIPDLPTTEAMPYLQTAKAHGIAGVLLATPACQNAELQIVAKQTAGFTYVVTRPGVTGTDYAVQFERTQIVVRQLEDLQAPPCVFGFGIKHAADVLQAYRSGAKGVIIGSALIAALQKLYLQQAPSAQEIVCLTRFLFGKD